MARLVVLAVCFVHVAGTAHNYEWAGLFETPESTYKWGAEKATEDPTTGVRDYADPGMKMVLISTAEDTDEALEAVEPTGDSLLAGTCTPVNDGDTLTPTTAGVCYQLNFAANEHVTMWTVDTSNAAHVVFFCEHHPIEFERDAHFFKDLTGEDIEPVHTLPEEAAAPAVDHDDHDDAKPWGLAMGGCALVNLCTLIGVIFLVPFLGKFAENNKAVFNVVTSGFAAGALLAAAFFLLLFEGVHLVAAGPEEESDQIAIWGCSILAGLLIGVFIDSITLAVFPKTFTADNAADKEAETPLADKSDRMRVLSGVLLGDFVHNICDGVFIGAAFLGCGNTFGWGVTAGSIYHEIAQEIADYFVLTDPEQGALSKPIALVLNFVSGLGVMLGAIIVLAQDEVDDVVTAVLLAIGGGVYVQIGACECLVRMTNQATTPGLRAAGLFMFAIGAVAIGLVLLDHEHCIPPPPPGAAPAAGGHHAH